MVGCDGRLAASGGAVEKAVFAVGGAEQVARADYMLLPLALDAERLPRSYYRKVIWGMDDGIYAFTTPPAYTGKPLYGTGWHWHNVLPSWTYGEEYVGKPIQVEAYCDCDEVEFFVNGESQGKAAPVEMIATLTVTYRDLPARPAESRGLPPGQARRRVRAGNYRPRRGPSPGSG